MNELFETHKKLNIKKLLLVAIIALFLIISIFDIILNFSNHSNSQNQAQNHEIAQNPNSIFYDANKKISVELSKKYELKQYNSMNNYLIELRSPNDLDIFISSKPLIENRTLSEVASADSNAYVENFNSSNLSKLSEFKIGDKIAYTYCFHYLDNVTKIPFYLQIVWLQAENCYYVFDIEFPLDNLENYNKIINETLNSFTEI